MSGRDYRPLPDETYVEMGAMRTAYDALRTLGEDSQHRAMTWLADRLRDDWRQQPPPRLATRPAEADPWDEEPPF